MSDLEERVAFVKDLKRFAVEELGVSQNPSFEKINLKTSWLYAIYVSLPDIIASPWEGHSGCKCYKADKKEWTARKRQFESYGWHIWPQRWEAEGIAECPITKAALKATKTRVAYLILHENTHIHCLINNIELPRDIEEPLADCVAYHGALLYYQRNNAMIYHIKQEFDQWAKQMKIINKYHSLINEAYSKNPKKVKSLLQAVQKELNMSKPANNAFFIAFGRYSLRQFDVFEALRDLHPKEYLQDKGLLYSRFGHLLPQKAE
ncbi:MAG: hypothetical protein KJ955_01725 [Nanoarchaeota archaeon]|nr:hypothetical protein [Nanoarchaeota archaeon]